MPINEDQSPTFLLVGDALVALRHASDGETLLTAALENGLYLLELLGGNHQDHADSHIEGAQHLFLRNIADFLQVLKDGEHWPGVDLHDRTRAFGQYPRQVFRDSAASNVSHG